MEDSSNNTSQLLAQANASQLNTSQQDFEAEEEVGLELPPPMKPIQEPHLIANGPPTFNKDMMKDNSSVMVSTRFTNIYVMKWKMSRFFNPYPGEQQKK